MHKLGCQAKARVDMIKLNDITLTFVRNNIPQKLFKWLKNKDFEIIEKFGR